MLSVCVGGSERTTQRSSVSASRGMNERRVDGAAGCINYSISSVIQYLCVNNKLHRHPVCGGGSTRAGEDRQDKATGC